MGVASLGTGSGLPLETLVTQLIGVERKPYTKMQMTTEKLEQKISAYGRLKSDMAHIAVGERWTAGARQPRCNGRTFVRYGDCHCHI